MAPLLVLLATFVIAVSTIKIIRKDYDIAFAARIAMSVMLLFTSIGHFAFTQGMTMMMPDFIPYKTQMVYFTGIIEILAAIGLQIPSLEADRQNKNQLQYRRDGMLISCHVSDSGEYG
jgi:hypothetical protein